MISPQILITIFLLSISIHIHSQVDNSKDTIMLTGVKVLQIKSKRMHYFSKERDVYCSTVTLSVNDTIRFELIYRGQFSIPTTGGNLIYLLDDTCQLKEGSSYDMVLSKTCIDESGETFYRYFAVTDGVHCSTIRIISRKRSKKELSLNYKHSFFEFKDHLYKMKILACAK